MTVAGCCEHNCYQHPNNTCILAPQHGGPHHQCARQHTRTCAWCNDRVVFVCPEADPGPSDWWCGRCCKAARCTVCGARCVVGNGHGGPHACSARHHIFGLGKIVSRDRNHNYAYELFIHEGPPNNGAGCPRSTRRWVWRAHPFWHAADNTFYYQFTFEPQDGFGGDCNGKALAAVDFGPLGVRVIGVPAHAGSATWWAVHANPISQAGQPPFLSLWHRDTRRYLCIHRRHNGHDDATLSLQGAADDGERIEWVRN
jgi:hypothetical protein